MRAVICVANFACGVGKTTTAVSLAAELASTGFETLLIDADPQADATARLVDPESFRLSVADLVLAPDPSPQRTSAEPTRFNLEDVVVPTATPRLRLAPSRIGLAAAEDDTPLTHDSLSELLSEYGCPCDFAVIDTPSSFGPIAAACAVASTHLLVPVAPNTQGLPGLRCLVEFLGDMPCVRGRVELLGVLCNLSDCRSYPSGEFYESLRDEWGIRFWKPSSTATTSSRRARAAACRCGRARRHPPQRCSTPGWRMRFCCVWALPCPRVCPRRKCSGLARQVFNPSRGRGTRGHGSRCLPAPRDESLLQLEGWNE